MRHFLVAVLVLFGWASTAGAAVTVFAAASLKNALDEVAAEWDGDAILVYAGSSALARQIMAGAPADVFISANVDWMEAVEAEGLIADEGHVDLLGNEVVLIAHGEVAPFDPAELPVRLGDGRLAMALVDAVPAGIYGRAALAHVGVWDALASRVAQAENVRAALALVSRGEAPFGIVYATDLVDAPAVSRVATFDPESHPPIVYPAAVTREGDRPESRAFLAHLQSDTARAIFGRHGFAVR